MPLLKKPERHNKQQTEVTQTLIRQNEEIAKNKLALDSLDAYTKNLWENTKLSLDRIGARSILTNGNFEIDDKKY